MPISKIVLKSNKKFNRLDKSRNTKLTKKIIVGAFSPFHFNRVGMHKRTKKKNSLAICFYQQKS